VNSEIGFDRRHHEFFYRGQKESIDILHQLNAPLSLVVQVTRECNLNCRFCSESEQFPQPSLDSLIELIGKLNGTRRIYLSGGEPLLRSDIFDLILAYTTKFDIVGLPTNSTLITRDICLKLMDSGVSYINAGLDGPRDINNSVRGAYDGIIDGLSTLSKTGLEVSLSVVVLKETLAYLKYVIQIADVLNIAKVKLVEPIHRGRAKCLREEEFASKESILCAFDEIKELKRKLGWTPRIKFAFWEEDTEGYALLVYPDRRVFAWPILDSEDGVEFVGDLNRQDISDIWKIYPYKENHINKYIGITMRKA
jgi:MoaA/NifB/PqqE/SkfB family radical SAM enzyme